MRRISSEWRRRISTLPALFSPSRLPGGARHSLRAEEPVEVAAVDPIHLALTCCPPLDLFGTGELLVVSIDPSQTSVQYVFLCSLESTFSSESFVSTESCIIF
jgi:hypothetical protein